MAIGRAHTVRRVIHTGHRNGDIGFSRLKGAFRVDKAVAVGGIRGPELVGLRSIHDDSSEIGHHRAWLCDGDELPFARALCRARGAERGVRAVASTAKARLIESALHAGDRK